MLPGVADSFWIGRCTSPAVVASARIPGSQKFVGQGRKVRVHAARRRMARLVPGRPISRDGQHLPVKLFQNASLPNVKAEMDYFQTSAVYDADGPWPSSVMEESAFSETLLHHIFNPAQRLDGQPRSIPDQIHHFACHCDTFGTPSQDRLILGAAGGPQFSMTLERLKVRLGELAEKGKVSAEEMPLVFLNACGSASVDQRQLGSFVKFFLLNRNRGFIGAQTMIPDLFASEFAKYFYSNLVSRGLTVGEAVLRARRKLAERHRNLLGILYMHYGPAELRLADEVA